MDTLALQKQRPLLAHMDLTEARLQHVVGEYGTAKKMLEQYEGAVKAKPETEALWFYLQNHVMTLIGKAVDLQEPLGEYQHFVDVYHTDIQRKTIRMFYYLLLICTRESRHMESGAGRVKLWKKYPNIHDFHSNHIQDTSEVVVIANMLAHAPDVSLGEYTDYLVDAFQFPSYDSAFGGKKWKEIARPLRDFVHGTITAEMMMDVAFTLAHNGGPIFNKGMVYQSYDKTSLNKILDVQDSGQIPQAIAAHQLSHIDNQMIEYVRAFSKLAADVSGPVDWRQIKRSGGGKYMTEVNQQLADEAGADKITQLKEKAELAKALLVEELLMAEEENTKKNSVEIMPGVFVAKSERSLS